jgi:hypothetical protein
MYTDYFLKFDSEAEARAALYRIEGAVEADPENGVEAQEGYELANYLAIDLIGTIWKPTGQIVNTAEGDVPEMAPLPGYHVNVRIVGEAPELEPYRVFPETPNRMWA